MSALVFDSHCQSVLFAFCCKLASQLVFVLPVAFATSGCHCQYVSLLVDAVAIVSLLVSAVGGGDFLRVEGSARSGF